MIARPADIARSTPMEGIGRILPHSPEAEKHLLACCLIDGQDVVSRCLMAKISAASFYVPAHGIVYDAILDLYGRQKPISISVLAEELKTSRTLDSVGGYAYLAEISASIPTTVQATYFIEKVREQATLRAFIRSRTASVEDAYNFSGDIDGFLSEATAKEGRVTADSSGQDEVSVQEEARDLITELRLPKDQRKGSVGLISWSIPDLDRRCGQMAPGDLIVLAGPPSSGKSALADQVIWAAARCEVTTLLFSYEMSRRKKVIRIAQQEARMNIKDFDGSPKDRQFGFLGAIQRIADCPHLHIFQRDTTLARLEARVRAIHQRKPVGLIIVDFLQYLARLEPLVNKERTDERIGRITASLKSLGASCGCPVMLLSSMNREGYKTGAAPGMANLKASGEIESDADVVMLLNWPKTNPRTGAEQDPHDEMQNSFYVEAKQEKGRDTGVHMVPLMFNRNWTRFEMCGGPRPPT